MAITEERQRAEVIVMTCYSFDISITSVLVTASGDRGAGYRGASEIDVWGEEIRVSIHVMLFITYY